MLQRNCRIPDVPGLRPVMIEFAVDATSRYAFAVACSVAPWEEELQAMNLFRDHIVETAHSWDLPVLWVATSQAPRYGLTDREIRKKYATRPRTHMAYAQHVATEQGFQRVIRDRDIPHGRLSRSGLFHRAPLDTFGRLLRESFHEQLLDKRVGDIDSVRRELSSWLHWYNDERRLRGGPHSGKTPMDVVHQIIHVKNRSRRRRGR